MKKHGERERIELFNEGWHAVLNVYEQYAKSVGLSFISYSVLEVIYYTPENCTQKLIAQKTYLPKQSINSVVTNFWKQGYVELKEIPTDRRNKTIHFTESGMEYAKNILLRMSKAEVSALDKMSLEQVKLLTKVTQDFVNYIKTDLNIE